MEIVKVDEFISNIEIFLRIAGFGVILKYLFVYKISEVLRNIINLSIDLLTYLMIKLKFFYPAKLWNKSR